MLISVHARKNQLDLAQQSTGYAVALFFAKKSLTKPTGVLEHCGEENTNGWFYLSGLFLLTASLMQRRMSKYIYLLKAKISVNYASDSR